MAGEPGGAPAGAFTQEQMDAIQATVSSIVNSAISSRDKMADKKRAEDRDAFKKMLDESLGALKPAATEPPEGKEPKGKDRENVELATMRKRLEELAQRSDTFEARAKEERAKSRTIGLRTAVTEALTRGYGMDPQRARLALTALVADGAIAYADDDSDEIIYRGDDGVAVDFQTGLRSWAKTPDAMIFLPPKGTQGSGGRPGGTGGFGNNGKPTREQQAAMLANILDQNL